MASPSEHEIQDVGVIDVQDYNAVQNNEILVTVPIEIPVENMDFNQDLNLEYLGHEEIVPQPVEVVIDSNGTGLISDDLLSSDLLYSVNNEIVTESEVYIHTTPTTECSRKGKGSRRNGARSKYQHHSNYVIKGNNSRHVVSENNDFSLPVWSRGKLLVSDLL